jgi:4-alpha-glucanotransferase
VTRWKSGILGHAWQQFLAGKAKSLRGPFEQFRASQSRWLDDYALFMALKEVRPAMSWTSWPAALMQRKPAALRTAREELSDAIGRQQFIQFLFFRQLDALRRHARQRSVQMIGDLPIFISADSSDVWANPQLFQLDRQRRPKAVAGVPPDYFAKTGQRWGNPLYDWDAMRRDGYAWWIERAKGALAQADLVRLDHFRGFSAYWRIPAHHPTAERGRWIPAPGRELFAALRRELHGLPFIAEDLGMITPDVESLRDEFGLPGMRVLQFAFGGGDSPFLPHNYIRNTIAYTGTHDNDTTAGWFAQLSRNERAAVVRYAPLAKQDVAWEFIRLAWASVAKIAVAPMQDVLRLGSKARINTPGKPTGNWGWRLRAADLTGAAKEELGALTETFGRQAAHQASAQVTH